jgi:cytochrome P450
LAQGEGALQKMVYLSAVIKETLRLFPPAGSARWADQGEGLHLRLRDGSEISGEGMVIYICHYGVQRDRLAFGDDADEWRPERWLGDTDTSMESGEKDAKIGSGGIPASAWRPFERGPRNCIGQELANLEARVILACLVRRAVFEKVGIGAVVDGKVEVPLTNVSILSE